MTRKVTHWYQVKPGVFGGTLTTSLCGRLRTTSDGMNLTDDMKEVSCKFCIKSLSRAYKTIRDFGDKMNEQKQELTR